MLLNNIDNAHLIHLSVIEKLSTCTSIDEINKIKEFFDNFISKHSDMDGMKQHFIEDVSFYIDHYTRVINNN